MRIRSGKIRVNLPRSRAKDILTLSYGLSEEEASLVLAVDRTGDYTRWMEKRGKTMGDVVSIYNSACFKRFEAFPEADGLHCAYIFGGRVYFTDIDG